MPIETAVDELLAGIVRGDDPLWPEVCTEEEAASLCQAAEEHGVAPLIVWRLAGRGTRVARHRFGPC